ncbi:Lactate utilization protein A [Stieleria bergensis]|uniref:Lactate utilization protein A n=1 Tax=Stieleria bergensis TaxID=2528025 RepID=A0A517SU33_9BACT|nr:MAG: Fe-S oxidoreductase [Rhodopirellula sp. TMED11]QDT59632.1 Lactate utilization protein A [Planctomycetes bacterium SV_7m_r]
MSVALFVPCYIDQLYPDVAIATLEILERLGIDVDYPGGQTCCGQPMANTGCQDDTAPVAKRFVDLFADYEAIVCPSGSCVSMVRNHYSEFFDANDKDFQNVTTRTYELCEYLHDVVKLDHLDVTFPHTVSLHQSCHGLRELRLGQSSESMEPRENKVRKILELVNGIQWVEPDRRDDCCGFGGTFAVNEADVSAEMGRARIADHCDKGSQVLASADMSCLMHLQGLIRREQSPITVMHVAQILTGRPLDAH